jgi:hypothetical protein
MRTSYGVVWREGALPLASGKLELLPRAVRLDGMAGSVPTRREIAYDLLSEIRIGRSASDRIDGRPTLAIASVAQTGVIAEIAERLAGLQFGPAVRRRTAVVIPLREGALDAVRSLLAAGPPFDPDRIGLDRHDVYLTPSEAIFVFESRLGEKALEPLLEQPELWQSAAAWHAHVAGPPTIAEDVYSWTRPEAGVDRSLLPPGLRNGNGDSH